MNAVWKESRILLQGNGSFGCAAEKTTTTGKLATSCKSEGLTRCEGLSGVNIGDRLALHVLSGRLPEATPISATEVMSFSMGQGRTDAY